MTEAAFYAALQDRASQSNSTLQAIDFGKMIPFNNGTYEYDPVQEKIRYRTPNESNESNESDSQTDSRVHVVFQDVATYLHLSTPPAPPAPPTMTKLIAGTLSRIAATVAVATQSQKMMEIHTRLDEAGEYGSIVEEETRKSGPIDKTLERIIRRHYETSTGKRYESFFNFYYSSIYRGLDNTRDLHSRNTEADPNEMETDASSLHRPTMIGDPTTEVIDETDGPDRSDRPLLTSDDF